MFPKILIHDNLKGILIEAYDKDNTWCLNARDYGMSVDEFKKFFKNGSVNGCCDYFNNTIYLSKHLNNKQRCIILLHEFAHFIAFKIGGRQSKLHSKIEKYLSFKYLLRLCG